MVISLILNGSIATSNCLTIFNNASYLTLSKKWILLAFGTLIPGYFSPININSHEGFSFEISSIKSKSTHSAIAP
ncbi:hypothetical protein D3C74_366300 [compost metagenome]